MDKLTKWIKHHQVTTFLFVTFAITGGLGFSYDAVMNRGADLLAPLVFIATCGPALAGIIVSAICNDQPKQGKKRITWLAFIIAWVISAFIFLTNNIFINHAPFSPGMVIVIFVIVMPVAFVISMAYSRIPAVRGYLASLVQLRGMLGWLFLALVLVPTLVLLSILISDLLDRQSLATHRFSETGLVLIGMIVVKFLYQLFFFNATGEETGWRGFALPRIQSFTSPLIACLVLNIFWPLWHVFFWSAEGKDIFSLAYWAKTYLELFPGTVILCWLYNRSKGSILTAGIAHAAANTAYAFFPNLDWTVYDWTVGVVALVIILVDRMWKKLPSDHPAVYQEPLVDRGL